MMKAFNTSVCVIDTCSIISLDGITLARKSILQLMRDHCKVFVSSEVCSELKERKHLLKSREAAFWPSFSGSVVFTPKVLCDDDTLRCFHNAPPAKFTAKGAGERGNARVSLEILLSRDHGHVVFLTDDIRAGGSFLDAMAEAFPGINMWTTTDLILYIGSILMKEGSCTWDDTRNALRDLRTNAGNIKRFKTVVTDELISLSGKHKRLLNTVLAVTKCWR